MWLEGCVLRNSAIGLRQNFLLTCFMDKGILLMLLKNLFILKLMLYFSFFIHRAPSTNALLSARMRMDNLDSLRMFYSVTIEFAREGASISHRDQL